MTGLALASLPEIRIICTTALPFSILVRLTKLDRILSAEGQLQPVLAKTRDIRALAELVDGFLPSDLARRVRVANFREGQLVLLAEHSATAAKLRLLAPSLSRFLVHQRWQVSSVLVRVQPSLSRFGATQKTVHFSTNALASLRKLHDQMRGSPARQALAALLDRSDVRTSSEALRRRTTAVRRQPRKPNT